MSAGEQKRRDDGVFESREPHSWLDKSPHLSLWFIMLSNAHLSLGLVQYEVLQYKMLIAPKMKSSHQRHSGDLKMMLYFYNVLLIIMSNTALFS